MRSSLMRAHLRIISKRIITVRSFGGCNRPTQIEGQLTHCKFAGIDAYVRENIRIDTFLEMTSGTRLAYLERGFGYGLDCLELAADCYWDQIAAAVNAMDRKHRPVLRNHSWTTEAARRALKSPISLGEGFC